MIYSYFQINLLLLVSLLLFQGGLQILRRGAIPMRRLARLAQYLLLLSLTAPLLFSAVSIYRLPRLHLVALQPISDSIGVTVRNQTIPKLRSALPKFSSSKAPEHPSNSFFVNEEKIAWAIFILGFAFFSARLFKNIRRLRSIIHTSNPIRCIGAVMISVSESISTPLSTMINGQPLVLLPTSILQNPRDMQIAIRHELQHHRQGDTRWALAIEFIQIMFYLNPAIYYWKRAIVELQEFSCDEALLGRSRVSSNEYGSCLLRVAEAALGNREMLVGTACMAANSKNPRYFKSFLRKRVEMFSEYKLSRQKKSVAILLGTISIFITTFVAYGAQQWMSPNRQTQPNPGRAIFNPAVQAIAEDALQKAVDKFAAKGGFVVVSDPITGKLLAVANTAPEPERQGKIWALSYQIEPASIIKTFVTAAALNNHLTAPDEMLDCGNGEYLYGHNLFHDWKAFGNLSLTNFMVNSSTICGIKIGERLGVSGLENTLHSFGFGSGGSSTNFPEAAAGDIPRSSQLSPEEYIGLISAGYTLQADFRVTPLEMVTAMGTIANGGKLMKPLMANEFDTAASVVGEAISPESALEMKSILRKVVTDGTGKKAQSAIYTTAGKTSTANGPGTNLHQIGGEEDIAGFAGFAPVDNPRVAIYVAIIDPSKPQKHNPHGGEHAAPVFKEVAERVLQLMNVESDIQK